jgi:hypothetical protein
MRRHDSLFRLSIPGPWNGSKIKKEPAKFAQEADLTPHIAGCDIEWSERGVQTGSLIFLCAPRFPESGVIR